MNFFILDNLEAWLAMNTFFCGLAGWSGLIPAYMSIIIFGVFWLSIYIKQKAKNLCIECEMNDICPEGSILKVRCIYENIRKTIFNKKSTRGLEAKC